MNIIELKALREEYKKKIEQELRDNQLHGINFVIDKVMDELFDRIANEG